MIELIFFNVPENTVSKKKILSVGQEILKRIEREDASLNLVICDETTIRERNKEFRNIDRSTDVLSWSYDKDESFGNLLGEIMICREVCQKNSDENGWDFETEFIRLLVHAVAHLLGYDHQTEAEEKAMLSLEKKLLHHLKLPDIYPDKKE